MPATKAPLASALFKKLNLGAHTRLHILNAPASFEPELTALQGVVVERSAAGPVAFAMAFVATQSQLEAASTDLVQACVGDAILWMAYPEASSRRYRCEFNRDSGWPTLGAVGFEPVRMVAIDEDWSALRFRRVQYIKTLARAPSNAISAGGKAKAAGRVSLPD